MGRPLDLVHRCGTGAHRGRLQGESTQGFRFDRRNVHDPPRARIGSVREIGRCKGKSEPLRTTGVCGRKSDDEMAGWVARRPLLQPLGYGSEPRSRTIGTGASEKDLDRAIERNERLEHDLGRASRRLNLHFHATFRSAGGRHPRPTRHSFVGEALECSAGTECQTLDRHHLKVELAENIEPEQPHRAPFQRDEDLLAQLRSIHGHALFVHRRGDEARQVARRAAIHSACRVRWDSDRGEPRFYLQQVRVAPAQQVAAVYSLQRTSNVFPAMEVPMAGDQAVPSPPFI
jgi:hypothetical protein